MFSASAWAANSYETDGEAKAPQKFTNIEGQIPLTKQYALVPTKSDTLLANTGMYKHLNC